MIKNSTKQIILVLIMFNFIINVFAGIDVYVMPPSAYSSERCGPGVVGGMEVFSNSDGITFVWYASETTQDELARAGYYETPFLEETTTYYVAADSAGNLSERVPVQAIINPLPIIKNTTVNNIKCSGENNGSILVEADGGSAPYTYTWSSNVDGQTGNYVHSLAAGTYTIRVRDSKYCSSYIDSIRILSSSVFIDVVDFMPSPSTDITTKTEVYFTNNSSGDGLNTYYWDFGDGNTSSSESIDHFFSKDGIYNVCLTVSDSVSGCSKSICKELIVGTEFCNAKYTYSKVLKTVNFTSPSVGTPTGYYWDFGDGTTSTEADPIKKYTDNGYYDVSLSIVDTNKNCSDKYSEQVKIGILNCNAQFTQSVNPSTKEVSFLDNSEGTISRYFWNFGDGNTSKMKNPKHIYDELGMIYKVKLTVSTLSGLCVSRVENDVPVGTINCSANFSYMVEKVTKTVKFGSEAIGGSSLTYYWEFGDGYNSTSKAPFHIYAATGYYYVSLVTYDDASGCMDYYSEIIMVGEPGDDCEASFMYQPNELSVEFFDDSRGENLSKYLWNFGDGNISTDQNPSNVYDEAGFYNVCLSVLSPGACKNTSCEKIKVGNTEKCVAAFIYTVDTITKSVSFKNKTLGVKGATGLSYLWEFGDNLTSDSVNPTHTYTTEGFYKVKLSVKSTNGKCKSFGIDLLSVGASSKEIQPIFDFENGPSKKGVYPTDFTGASYGEPASFAWSFGDGEGDSTSMSPTHDYSDPGEYNVCLEISDPNTGQSNKACDTIEVIYTGINNVVQIGDLKVFPNPVNDVLKISYLSNVSVSKLSVVFYDNFGRSVIEKVYSNKRIINEQIDVSNLPSGLYFINVITDESSITKKVIIY